jgi:hypothetical protein
VGRLKEISVLVRVAVMATIATASSIVAGQASQAATPATRAAAAGESKDFPFPGADTMALNDGSNKYITYGASVAGRKVPYSISGSGNVVGRSGTIDGDALPHGGGAWVKKGSGIWAPGVFYKVKGGVGRYYLFYTASNRSDRKCIGVASSTNPVKHFHSAAKPIVCPTKGDRWALDADIVAGPKGGVWMTWRDGQRAVGPESAISVMRLGFKADGTVRGTSAPTVIMRSNNLAWAHYKDGTGVTVIENPSAFYNAGSWYLFYSGNSWPTNYYATGIAYCGRRIDDGLCTQIPGNRKAYFSYSGPRNHLPAGMRKYGLPGNKRGPGAMAVYRARDGKPWVTWNYLSDHGGRKSTTARLVVTGTGASADFKVTR